MKIELSDGKPCLNFIKIDSSFAMPPQVLALAITLSHIFFDWPNILYSFFVFEAQKISAFENSSHGLYLFFLKKKA